jgi:hypothetical protein
MNRHQIVNIPYNLLIKLRNSSDLYTRHWFWIYVKHNLSHLKWWLMLKRMVFYSYLLHLRNFLLYCGYFWRNHTHWRNSLFDTVVEELGTGDIGKRYMPELLPHTYLLSLICCCLNKDFYPLLKLQSMGERGTERGRWPEFIWNESPEDDDWLDEPKEYLHACIFWSAWVVLHASSGS